MKYFHNLAAQALQPPSIDKARAEGRKVVGFYCAMVPQELIAAFDAVPVRLCSGMPASPNAELPRDCCPVVTSSYQLLRAGSESTLSQIDAVIIPTVCDWKTQLADLVASRLPTLRMQIPANKREPSAQRERLSSLSSLIRFLEEITGRSLSRQRLLESIRTYQQANLATRQLADCLLADVPRVRGSDVLLVMNVSFYSDIPSWTSAVFHLVSEAQQEQARNDSSKPGPRLLLTGAPIIWPNWKVPEAIEEAGGEIVAEELCSGARVFYDPVKIDEPTMDDMLRALAERYALACTCPCFVPNDDRIYRNITLARRYRVGGIIYHNLRTCYLYQAEAGSFRKKFRELDIPFLEIETDYSPEDREQVTVRIEPFIEMLRSRIRRPD